MHPTLFHIAGWSFLSYDFFMVLGYLIGIGVIFILIRKQSFPQMESRAYVLFAVAVSLAGAKIFMWIGAFIHNPSFYLHEPGILGPWPRGRGSSFGALLSAFLFSLWYLKKYRLPFWPMGDTVAPGMAIAQSIMKIGCFMAGCCYGSECSLPWSVTFPGQSISRHPTQIYESILYFLNFLFLYFIFHKKKFPGQVISLYLINYSAARFISEFFRGDPSRGYLVPGSSSLSNLSYPQIICLGGMAFGIGLYCFQRRKSLSRFSSL